MHRRLPEMRKCLFGVGGLLVKRCPGLFEPILIVLKQFFPEFEFDFDSHFWFKTGAGTIFFLQFKTFQKIRSISLSFSPPVRFETLVQGLHQFWKISIRIIYINFGSIERRDRKTDREIFCCTSKLVSIHNKQCDQICQNFATLAFLGLILYLGYFWTSAG